MKEKTFHMFEGDDILKKEDPYADPFDGDWKAKLDDIDEDELPF